MQIPSYKTWCTTEPTGHTERGFADRVSPFALCGYVVVYRTDIIKKDCIVVLRISNSVVGSIVCKKPARFVFASPIPVKPRVVYLYNCRVLGAISLESGWGKVIVTERNVKWPLVSPKISG